jgi:hypothetical protein
MGGLDSLLEKIASQPGLIVDDGVVIAGHSKHEDLKETYGPLRLTSHRQYGDNVIDFFVYEQDSDLTQPPETRMNIDEGTNSGEDGDLSW